MIKVSNIKKKYGKRIVLDDISFRADGGECVAVVGRNGCGKTTLMRILAGVMRPDFGQISYFNKNPLKNSSFFRKYCGYVPQELPLMEELSVKDNLKLWQANKSDNFGRIVKDFKLEEIMKTRVSKLSGGMKRRLSIACAFAQQPLILLMDEPTTALDIYCKEEILKWIDMFLSLNGIVIMTTHDEKEILNCSRCLVMNDGRLEELEGSDINMEVIKSRIL